MRFVCLPHRAVELLHELLSLVPRLAFPRSTAYATLGLARLPLATPASRAALAEAAYRLDAADSGRADWRWYEPELTYDNARLPQALLAAGRSLGAPALVARSLDRLDWYLEQVGLTGEAPMLRCVGNQWRRPGGSATVEGDEQPIDAASTVEALAVAWLATRRARYARLAMRAQAWFYGHNRASLALYDATSGGCRDGLAANGTNPNQGAESTLAYYQSHLAIVHAGLTRRHRNRGAGLDRTLAAIEPLAPAAPAARGRG
jgi:hypothetical protein